MLTIESKPHGKVFEHPLTSDAVHMATLPVLASNISPGFRKPGQHGFDLSWATPKK
jgi:hypothetical protein